MLIDVITIFPDMFRKTFEYGIIGQAIKSGIIQIKIHDLRKWTKDKHKQVDDRPYGGGPGMILKPEPLFEAIEELQLMTPNDPNSSGVNKTHVIFMTPTGKTLNQQLVEEIGVYEHIIIICGRYEGVDQRVIDSLVDVQISIGNYVLSGGEIPAMVVIDCIARKIPGVIKNDEFNKDESFSDPNNRELLDYPQYTRPPEYNGLKVPDILLTGNHNEIAKWRKSLRKIK